jgi:hypothetical protein
VVDYTRKVDPQETNHGFGRQPESVRREKNGRGKVSVDNAFTLLERDLRTFSQRVADI